MYNKNMFHQSFIGFLSTKCTQASSEQIFSLVPFSNPIDREEDLNLISFDVARKVHRWDKEVSSVNNLSYQRLCSLVALWFCEGIKGENFHCSTTLFLTLEQPSWEMVRAWLLLLHCSPFSSKAVYEMGCDRASINHFWRYKAREVDRGAVIISNYYLLKSHNNWDLLNRFASNQNATQLKCALAIISSWKHTKEWHLECMSVNNEAAQFITSAKQSTSL